METIKELLSNFLKAQEEKIKTPTFITFFIAFLVFKIWIYWKPISIFLLSTKAIEERILAIDNKINLIEQNFSNHPLWLSILFALAITISYTILFPLIQLGVNVILSWVKKKNFNIKADIETEIRKRKIEIEKTEQELRNLKNQNATNRNLNEQLRGKDDQIDNLLEEMKKISKNSNNKIDNLKEIHSNETRSIREDYQSKIEQLNNTISELKDNNESIVRQLNEDLTRIKRFYEEELKKIQTKANSENEKLRSENENLRSEIEQLKSKNSS